MSLSEYKGPANAPECARAMVGETIVGVIFDYEGAIWQIVKSGHAFVVNGNRAYWIESPNAVRNLIAKRKADLGTWAAEAARMMDVEGAIS